MPIFLSPTAMQRLYDPEGDKASARAAEKLGTKNPGANSYMFNFLKQF